MSTSPDTSVEVQLRYRSGEARVDLGDYPNVKKLRLVGFPDEAFPLGWESIPHLEALHIRRGLRQWPKAMNGLASLTHFQLEYCPQLAIPARPPKWPKLESISLKYMHLPDLSERWWQFPHLKRMNLDHNVLEEVPAGVFKASPGLELSIRYNLLEEMPSKLAGLDLHKLVWDHNPFYNRLSPRQSQLSRLYRQFRENAIEIEQREVFWLIFLGYVYEACARHGEAAVLEGLNAPNKEIRQQVLLYLYESRANPFTKLDEKASFRIYLAGKKMRLDTAQSRQSLSRNLVQVEPHLQKDVEYVVLGEYPKKDLPKALAWGIPLLAQAHLQDFVNRMALPYLSRPGAQGEKAAQKLVKLLRSEDLANQKLGLEMALGGGIHPDFFYDLLLLYIWNPHPHLRKMAAQVLERYAPPSLVLHLKLHVRGVPAKGISEKMLSRYLQKMLRPPVEGDELAIRFFEKFAQGRHFCLQFPRAFRKVCKLGKIGGTLSLSRLGISELSELIGEESTLKTLYLNQNDLKDLPHSMRQLHNLQNLFLAKNQLSDLPSVCRALNSLRRLSLARNKIKELHLDLGKLANLEYLNLQDNPLLALDLGPKVKTGKKLRVLDIRNTPLVSSRNCLNKLQEHLGPGQLRY